VEAEAIPGRHGQLGLADAQPDLWRHVEAIGHALRQGELVEVVEVDVRASFEGQRSWLDR